MTWGRNASTPDPSEVEMALLRLQTAADEVIALVKDTALTHRGNRALVNLSCDVHNLLQPHTTAKEGAAT